MTRLQTCKQCPYSSRFGKLVSCGDFLVGNQIVVEVEGKMQDVHLCGCVMNIKTKIKSAKCPLKKW